MIYQINHSVISSHMLNININNYFNLNNKNNKTIIIFGDIVGNERNERSGTISCLMEFKCYVRFIEELSLTLYLLRKHDDHCTRFSKVSIHYSKINALVKLIISNYLSLLFLQLV